MVKWIIQLQQFAAVGTHREQSNSHALEKWNQRTHLKKIIIKECEQLKKINPNRCVLVAFILFFYAHIVFADSHANTHKPEQCTWQCWLLFAFKWRFKHFRWSFFHDIRNAHTKSFASFKCYAFRHIESKRFRLIQSAKITVIRNIWFSHIKMGDSIVNFLHKNLIVFPISWVFMTEFDSHDSLLPHAEQTSVKRMIFIVEFCQPNHRGDTDDAKLNWAEDFCLKIKLYSTHRHLIPLTCARL